MDFDFKDVVMVIAVIAGPILAVQIQKYLESIKEVRVRKNQIFNILMSTRATRLSADHVAALNMIDIEFYGEKKIINAWKLYHDHLCNKGSNTNDIIWNDKGYELFIALLYSMAQYLKYDFDEVHLKRGCYLPIAHGEIEHEVHRVRKGLVDVLNGEKSISMTVTNFLPSKNEEL